jgi:hypothetical protein
VPNIDFWIDDDEYAYEGTAYYSIRRGDKGDLVTPPVADAVDEVLIRRISAYGIVVGDKTTWYDTKTPDHELTWKRKLMASRLLMERLEELCEADLLKGER